MPLARAVHVRPICPLVLHPEGKVKGIPSQFVTSDGAEGRICGESRAGLRQEGCIPAGMGDCRGKEVQR